MPVVSTLCMELIQKLIDCVQNCDEREYDRLADKLFYLCQPLPEPEEKEDCD